MEIVIFGRFQAKPGCEAEVAAALREVQAPTRAEPGCLEIHLYRSVKDSRLFYIHSRWRDMAGTLPGFPDSGFRIGIPATWIGWPFSERPRR